MPAKLPTAWIAVDFLLNLAAAADCVQLVPNFIQKWNCAAGDLQLFLSEIIGVQENGSCGENLTQISNWHIYMGIAA